MSIEVDMEKDVKGEVSLARKGTIQSITSDLAEKRNDGRNQQEVDEDKYSTLYLFMRIGLLDREGLWSMRSARCSLSVSSFPLDTRSRLSRVFE